LIFFRRSELTDDVDQRLAFYDREVRRLVGPDYPYPLRMRDWELWRVLQAAESLPPEAAILEGGSFNTYLGLFLSRDHRNVTVSDRLGRRRWKSFLRGLGLAPAKKTEAAFPAWSHQMRRRGLRVRDIDLERIGEPDGSFPCVIALSVIEHVPRVEQALAEMHRVLAPGGRMLITTDCAPEPVPYAGGVRYFSPAELEELFSPYAVTSPRGRPDFARENWCYGGGAPVVTAFIEVTKPR
jgi:SAM-dependent methyltransferase